MTWHNVGGGALVLAVLTAIIGANEASMFLSLASVGCVMLDIVVG